MRQRLLPLCVASSLGLIVGMVVRSEGEDMLWMYRYLHARGDVE